jgi:hypothetical protein
MNNIKIDEKTKEVNIMVNTMFYPKELIIKTGEIFKDFCWVRLDGDPEGCMLISLTPKNEDVDNVNIGFEFMNHLLAGVKEIEGF